MADVPTYTIRTMGDFNAIPVDRIDRCCADLHVLVETIRQMRKADGRFGDTPIVWRDDDHAVTMNIRDAAGNKLGSASIERPAVRA